MQRLTGIKTYLEPHVAEAVSRVAQARGRSESRFVAEAVEAALARASEAVAKAEEDSLARMLSRIEVRLDRLFRDQLRIRESLWLFVQVWLEYNPQLDPALADSAALSAEARFERFLEIIAEKIAEAEARPTSRPVPRAARQVEHQSEEREALS